jgi:N-acetylmuramoyl-L-alanine amidase
LLTREEDVRVPLQGRVTFANSHKADLFISIHVNYLPVEPLLAIETYYFGFRSDRQTFELVERENQESEYGMGDFKDMLEKVGNTMKLQESKALAISVQKNLYGNVSRQNSSVSDSGVKTAPFVVLLEASMPSILVEVACLNNRKEEAKLGTGTYRETLAAYLEEGVVHYLNERSRPAQPEGGVTSHVARKGERSK